MASLSSLEVKAMLAHTEGLTTTLSTNPLAIVGLLLDKEFIPSEVQDKMMTDTETREGRAAILVEAVTHEIECSPDKLEIFLQVLSEQKWSKEIGEKLRSTYRSHQKNVALVPYNNPSSSANKPPSHKVQEIESVPDQSLHQLHAPGAVEKASYSEQTITENDLVALLNLLHNFSDKWFDIGLGLGFAPPELNLIRSMPSLFMKAPVSYLTQLLSQWLLWPTAEHSTKPTLGRLCATLRSSHIGLGSLADKVEEEMKSHRTGLPQNSGYLENPLDMNIATVIKNFEDRFNDLHEYTRSELINSHTETNKVLGVLTLLPMKLRNEYKEAIRSMLPTLSPQRDIEELFLHLNPLLSFIDYGLLEHIINKFGSVDLKESMRCYSGDMQEFMKKTTIRQLIGHIPGDAQKQSSFALVVAKVGLNAGECTLAEVNAIRISYCSRVNLSEIIFHLVAVTKANSFIVKWLIPSVIVTDVMSSTRAIESSFFQDNAIVSLAINKVCLYDETTSTKIAQFNSLQKQTLHELNDTRTSIEDLAICLAEKLTSLEPGDSIYLIELILKKSLLSFADFKILNFIVQKFGSDKLKKNMKTYIDGISICARQITVQHVIDLMPERSECPENFVPIECNIIEKPSHYTLEGVLSLQDEFLSDMNFNKLTLVSIKIQDSNISGSFSVSWLVPTNQTSRLNQFESDLFQREKIASLSIGSKLLYNQKLFEFAAQLKMQYQQFHVCLSPIEWILSPKQSIFRLAMIKREGVLIGQIENVFVQMSISSRIDDILHDKTPVKLKNIFESKAHVSDTILIEGSPNSRKTLLIMHIIHKWAKGEIFEQFTLVILVQLGDPAVQRAQSISDLLSCRDVELAQKLAAELEATNGRGVLWILDGWDELPPRLHQDSIFRKLLPLKSTSQYKRRLLTDSSVIVTSRPISSGDLHSVVSSRVEILGFTPEEQKQFFSDCFKGDTESLEVILKKIEDNLIIQSSCYLPLNAALIIHFFNISNHSLPVSEYELFTTIVICCVQHYFEQKVRSHDLPIELKTLDDVLRNNIVGDLFRQLCELAFRGIMQHKVTFSSSELTQGSNTLSLLREIESFLEGDKSMYYTFVHRSIQELLAAMHIATSLPDSEQVSQFQQLFHQPHYVGVFRFYSGITKLETPGIDMAVLETFSKCSKPQRLHLLRCMHEAQNSSLCCFVANSLTYWLPLFGASLSPLECLSLGYFISMSTDDKVKEVRLSYCHIGDYGVKHLTKYMCKNSDPEVQAANLKHPFGWIFTMDYNDIHDEGAACIATALYSSHVMNSLNLSNNKIGSIGLHHISHALITNTSLVELDLSCCKLIISEKSGPVIKEMLQKNQTLRTLNLSHNQGISDIGIFYIAEGLQKNVSLNTFSILFCNVTSIGAKHLSYMLMINNSLTSLCIAKNPIGNEGVAHLTEALQCNETLITLDIKDCDITYTGVVALTKALRVNKSLRDLDLRENQALTNVVVPHATSMKINLHLPKFVSSEKKDYTVARPEVKEIHHEVVLSPPRRHLKKELKGKSKLTASSPKPLYQSHFEPLDITWEENILTQEPRGLLGVDVCGVEVITITNSPLEWHWEKFGLKLHVCNDTLPPGIDCCQIVISASISGDYKFPDNESLVSAIFWFRCYPLCKFVKPVTVKLQHCACSDNVSNLSFVKAICTLKERPYSFKQVHGGSFSKHSSSGIVELTSFSGVAITQNGPEDQRDYLATLLYKEERFHGNRICFHLYFVITWNTATHFTVMTDYFGETKLYTKQRVVFISDHVEFRLSYTPDYWTIIPINCDVVERKAIDTFAPGKTLWIPHSQFKAKLSGNLTDDVPALHFNVDLHGAKSPQNKLTVDINPSPVADTIQHARHEQVTVDLPRVAMQHAIYGQVHVEQRQVDVKPTLRELMRELRSKAAYWEDIGVELQIDDGVLATIKRDYCGDSIDCMREMFRKWLMQLSYSPSWSRIAEAVVVLGDEELARKLKTKYNIC